MYRYDPTKLRDLMNERNMNSSELYSLLKDYCYQVSVPMIQKLVSGKNTSSAYYIYALSKIFNVPYLHFFRKQTVDENKAYDDKLSRRQRSIAEIKGAYDYVSDLVER